jgi:hypothetical protein
VGTRREPYPGPSQPLDCGGVEKAEDSEESADGIVGGEVGAMKQDKTAKHRKPIGPGALPEGPPGLMLHPVEFWIPDVESASFRAEARRQSKAIARSPLAGSEQDFIDLISDFVPGRRVRSQL